MLVDGYVRVSQVAGRSGPRFISPAVQRAEIERWAVQNNAVVAHVFEELDQSGARHDRPLLLEAIRRVEVGDTDGLVVPYLSRFGRSLVDGLVAIKRITDAGGAFISVQENVDFSTDTGRLVLRMLFSIAEWERDRFKSRFLVADERAIARGVSVALAPFGYRRGRTGRLEIDPETGPLATELFRLRASGLSHRRLAGWLMAHGVPTMAGKPQWKESQISSVLRKRAYRGELHYGRFSNLNAHEPLVDEATWQRAQTESLSIRLDKSPHPALLGGIVKCAGCQRSLRLGIDHPGASEEARLYRCAWAYGPVCTSRAIITDAVVEPYVEAIFWSEVRRKGHRRGSGRLRKLETEHQRREAELAAYRDNPRLPVTLGARRYSEGLAVRVRRAEDAKAALSRARLRAAAPALPDAEVLADRWTGMSVRDRRAAISEVIESVFVRPKTGSLEQRLFVCLRGTGPEPIRYESARDEKAVPFDWAAWTPVAPAPTTEEAEIDVDELRRRLEHFLDGETAWPPFRHFQEHGCASLYEQARHNGGPRYWARLLGLRYRPPNHIGPWTDARVRAELASYLEGRTIWPARCTFRKDRREALWKAAWCYGGIEKWAAELGVALPPSRRPQTRWSYALIRHEVRKLAGDSGRFPEQGEFVGVGLGGLEHATHRPGVRERLIADLRLKPPLGLNRRKIWNDDRIRETLDEFLQGRDAWPSAREFKEVGLGGLHSRLKHDRTIPEWAGRCGFEPPRHRGRTPARRLTP